MGKLFKTLLKAGVGVYALLFVVFFFDLDGKLLYYVVEPTLCKHYDNLPRRNVLKDEYKIDKFPDYN